MLDYGAAVDAEEAVVIAEYNDRRKSHSGLGVMLHLEARVLSFVFWCALLLPLRSYLTPRKVATKLANFTSTNSGITANLLNTTIPFQTVIDDPTAYGAANATCFDDDGTTCVWWNNYHPALASKFCLL